MTLAIRTIVVTPAPVQGVVTPAPVQGVVTPAPIQGVSDQRVQPDLGGTEKGVESKVELTLLEKPVTEVPVRRGSIVRVQTD